MSERARRATMADVARRAGVSAMTVSYAYNRPERVSEQAAHQVRAAAAQLGYPGPHPGARSLRRGRTGSVGVVMGEHLAYAFDDPQAARFLAGVAEVCAEQGLGMTLVPVTGQASDPARIGQAAVDGFVVWTTAEDDPVLDAVIRTGLPAVVHGRSGRGDLPTLGIDDRAAAAAIGALAFARARRPAVLSFPVDRRRQAYTANGLDPDVATFPVTRYRLQGLRDAWEATGGSWDDVRVAVCPVNSAEQGSYAAERLLSNLPPADAIAAMSDELAFGALRAARRAGLSIPAALAVSGWDGTDEASRTDLSTVAQDLRDQGRTCALLVINPTWKAGPPTWVTIPRGSTATRPHQIPVEPPAR